MFTLTQSPGKATAKANTKKAKNLLRVFSTFFELCFGCVDVFFFSSAGGGFSCAVFMCHDELGDELGFDEFDDEIFVMTNLTTKFSS